jgi:hypothetical protein
MSVLCDDVRQERSGKFILIGLFDVISVPAYPVVFPRICIVNRWCCGQGAFHERTRIVGADGGTVIAESKEVPVNLGAEEASVTNVQIFINLKLETEGVYWIEILLDGDIKLRYPVRANLVVMPPQGGRGGNG